MKHSFVYGFLAMAVFACVATTAPAHAEEASSTATSTSVVATTTTPVASTTVTAPVASTTSSTSSHIADLLAQLAKLTAIFNDLKAKLFGVQAQIAEVKAGLHEGSTGDDVTAVQDALASDPSIYPSGKKTGFFGPMTVEAIKKFQEKNGLEVTGTINAETKAALDTLLAQKRSEGHLPMGLMIAPGQHRDDFEQRVRAQCGASSTVQTATGTPAFGCAPIMKKYHMEDEDGARHGSSTTPWRPMNMALPRPMAIPMRGQGRPEASSTRSEKEHGYEQEQEQEHGPEHGGGMNDR